MKQRRDEFFCSLSRSLCRSSAYPQITDYKTRVTIVCTCCLPFNTAWKAYFTHLSSLSLSLCMSPPGFHLLHNERQKYARNGNGFPDNEILVRTKRNTMQTKKRVVEARQTSLGITKRYFLPKVKLCKEIAVKNQAIFQS